MSDMFNQGASPSPLSAEWQNYTLEEAQNLVRRYPYFAPAQFLLLQKLPKLSEEYSQQYGKAILYHKDVLEFESLINATKFTTDFSADTVVPEAQVTEDYEDLAIAEEVPEIAAVPIDESEEKLQESTEPVIAVAEEEKSVELTEEPSPALSSPVEVSEQSEIESHSLQHSELEQVSIEEAEKHESESSPLPAEEPKQLQPELPAIKTEAAGKPHPEPVEELAFEPYHTVDYFASQGIKATQDPAPTDRFGKQLKSFTEWLKTMKRQSPADLSKNIDPKTEKKVENLAEHSLHNPDVATEAMAEVWLKQGNREKAVEVYQKLSLLNPAKSAYFAAKIANLNRS